MKKSLEDKIETVVIKHLKGSKEDVVEIKVIIKKPIGFNSQPEISTAYWTK